MLTESKGSLSVVLNRQHSGCVSTGSRTGLSGNFLPHFFVRSSSMCSLSALSLVGWSAFGSLRCVWPRMSANIFTRKITWLCSCSAVYTHRGLFFRGKTSVAGLCFPRLPLPSCLGIRDRTIFSRDPSVLVPIPTSPSTPAPGQNPARIPACVFFFLCI